MNKYILIGGYIYKAQDGGKAFSQELIKGINNKPIKILVCLFARSNDDWENRFKDDYTFYSKNMKDFKLELALPEKFITQLKNSDVIFFQGGNPRQLISILETTGDWRKELSEKTIVGSSGGADAISKYYGVIKSLNVGEGLGLLPIKFIPHWKSNYGYRTDDGMDLLLEKLKLYKEDLETIVLKDGEFVVIEK